MSEKKLEREHQIFIVQQLAMFERPKSVRSRLKDEFGIEITVQAVRHYQITSKELSKELKKVFNATRKKFLKESDTIPIANKSYRLRKLQNIFEQLEDNPQPNTVEMRATLEQSAKETGDVFTNKQKVENSGEVRHSVVRVPAKITPEEWLKRSKQPITE